MNISTERDVNAENVTDAWVKALKVLMDYPKNEAFNLNVRIAAPTDEHPKTREIVDRYLAEKSGKLSKGHIETVAQTIFPESRLYFACPDPRNPGQRKAFYAQYMKDKSFIRAFNRRGTYFQRLIWWPSWDATNGINQLENIIQKINSGKRGIHFAGLSFGT